MNSDDNGMHKKRSDEEEERVLDDKTIATIQKLRKFEVSDENIANSLDLSLDIIKSIE